MVTEENEARSEARVFPEIKVLTPFSRVQALRFILSKKDPQLLQALHYWNQKISQDGTLARLRDRYEHPLTTLSPADLDLYFASIQRELKNFEGLFREAAADLHLPWQLIAAVSFQE